MHDQGVPQVRIKIGESSGSNPGRELARVAIARSEIGPDAELHVDANGGYTPGKAVRIARLLDSEDVTWFEEPVSSET